MVSAEYTFRVVVSHPAQSGMPPLGTRARVWFCFHWGWAPVATSRCPSRQSCTWQGTSPATPAHTLPTDNHGWSSQVSSTLERWLTSPQCCRSHEARGWAYGDVPAVGRTGHGWVWGVEQRARLEIQWGSSERAAPSTLSVGSVTRSCLTAEWLPLPLRAHSSKRHWASSPCGDWTAGQDTQSRLRWGAGRNEELPTAEVWEAPPSPYLCLWCGRSGTKTPPPRRRRGKPGSAPPLPRWLQSRDLAVGWRRHHPPTHASNAADQRHRHPLPKKAAVRETGVNPTPAQMAPEQWFCNATRPRRSAGDRSDNATGHGHRGDPPKHVGRMAKPAMNHRWFQLALVVGSDFTLSHISKNSSIHMFRRFGDKQHISPQAIKQAGHPSKRRDLHNTNGREIVHLKRWALKWNNIWTKECLFRRQTTTVRSRSEKMVYKRIWVASLPFQSV